MPDLDLARARSLKNFEKSLGDLSDPVMLLLRAHLYSESNLENLIRLRLPRGDKVNENASLSYHQKLVLIDAFDIIPDNIVSALRNMNKVRNECAHQLEKAISMNDVTRIGSSLGKDFTEMKKKSDHDATKLLGSVLTYICGYLDAILHFTETGTDDVAQSKA